MTPDDEPPETRPPMRRRELLINGAVCVAVVLGLMWLLLPAVSRVRNAPERMHVSNNLKQIALAEHNYADVSQDSFVGPLAQVSPGVLNPNLSFRVSLLPYLEEDSTYGRIDLTQPWDSPRNAPATSERVRAFIGHEALGTPYRVFYGGGALFEADGTPVKLKEVPDGLSNTVLFVHATEAVPWAKPQEFAYTPTTPLPPLGSRGVSRDGFNVAFADGSVRFLRHTIPEADLRSLIEKADGRGAGID